MSRRTTRSAGVCVGGGRAARVRTDNFPAEASEIAERLEHDDLEGLVVRRRRREEDVLHLLHRDDAVVVAVQLGEQLAPAQPRALPRPERVAERLPTDQIAAVLRNVALRLLAVAVGLQQGVSLWKT